jgi:hypothetical protein
MNQHLPPETVKEIGTIPAGTIAVRPTEQFLMLAGKREPWVYGDIMTRADVIEEVGDNYTVLAKIIAFSLEAGTCRDATDEITSIVACASSGGARQTRLEPPKPWRTTL